MPARLSRPDPAITTTETEELLALTERAGRPPATIELLAHSPTLLAPFLGWAAALARQGALQPRDHEILALRVAHLCESPFEWGEHRQFAEDAGLSAFEIDAIRDGADAVAWSEREMGLLRATDELHRDSRVSVSTYGVLAAHFNPAQLVEIPLVVGQYAMLSMLTGFFDVPARPA